MQKYVIFIFFMLLATPKKVVFAVKLYASAMSK